MQINIDNFYNRDKYKMTYVEEYDQTMFLLFPTRAITRVLYKHTTGKKTLTEAQIRDLDHDIKIVKDSGLWSELEHEETIEQLNKNAEFDSYLKQLPKIEQLKYREELLKKLDDPNIFKL